MALSSPIAGNHHDLYQIERALNDIFDTVSAAGIAIDGLFINADSGFDSKEFRLKCFRERIHANVDFNRRNGDGEDEYLLDEMLYKEKYSIERSNAWMDSFRSILNRFDVTGKRWESFNYVAFMVILLKKIKQKKKSK
ncbi:hypothetical protein FACS1894123_03380 [Bacteroidia bacterium]|nr:hypothetical protein FACS1894123_03380 [Bacteroidia bacterium]